MRKTLAILLVATGLALALYPVLERFYGDYRTQQLVESFEKSLESGLSASPAIEKSSELWKEPWEEKREHPEEEESPEEKKEALYRGPTPIAVLEIPKIELKLPVLKGANEHNLRYGAGLLDELADIGEEGNIVITAHRSHTYGRFFNRLDELEKGDEIVLVTSDKHFYYRVFNTCVVKAEDRSYLANDAGEQRLTLVTCHPLYRLNPPYRLVVQAEMAK